MKPKLLSIPFFLFLFQFSFAKQFPLNFEDAEGNKDTLILGNDPKCH